MPTSSADPNLIPIDNPILGMIDAEAARQGVDRNLAHAVAQIESGYDPRAVSGRGARGVFQLMPDTAKDMGVTDPMDPAQNIRGGIKYLAQLGGKYGADDPIRILAGYNAGPGNVDKYRGVPPFPETANYVDKGMRLLANASDLSADPNLTPVPVASPPRDLTPAAQPSVDVLPPLSEPPGWKAAPPEKTFKGFLDNATTGLGRILEPLADPAGTLENVTNLLQGMSEKSGFAPVMGQPKQQVVDGIVSLYKHRYGSLEGFKNAFYEDPVGIAADVATVFSGAGLGVDAAQDFLRASGLAEHAASIADILPEVKAVATAGTAETRIQAGVRGAVDALGKRYKEVVQAGFERAPSGVLGGPHGMLGAAKYGAGKKAAEILKEGWQAGTKAFDAPEATTAAEVAAPAAAPITPPDLAERAAQASMSPRVMLRSEAAQAFPEAYGQSAPAAEPPTALAAPPLTPQDLTELTTGRPPSRQSATAQQTAAETLATAQAAAPPAAPAAPSTTGLTEAGGEMGAAITGHMYDALWNKVLAGDITEGGQPSAVLQAARMVRQNGGLQTPESFRAFVADYTQVPRGPQFQAAMRDLVARHSPSASPVAPVVPEAPPAAPTVPPVPEAPTGPPVDPVAFVREQLAAGNRVSEATLQRQFGMKYSAARKLLKDLSPAATPEQGRAAFEAAKASGQPAVTPTPEEAPPATPEPPSELEQQLAQSIREAQSRKTAAPVAPAVKPGQTPAQALAEMMPESAVPPPAGGPPAPTASQLRIEAFAQHFAHDTTMAPEAIAAIASQSGAALKLEQLGRSLGIKGSPAPGEIARIAQRVRELRASPAR